MTSTTPEPDVTAVSLFEQLASYVNQGTTGPLLTPAGLACGAPTLRRLGIALLSWMSARSRIAKMTTMRLSEAGSAAEALEALIANDPSFSSVFVVEDGVVRLREEQLVPQLIEVVNRLHRPPRFVTYRASEA
ncbi:hypothetical protein OOT46_10295 [Aquabacterium sp. A7-Y]|uniref:hypothetical protein n=1 Tax=Aquabacterium sp. A7-Y TaxID=1349605 RepID=UPI00223E6E3F|nr:hypothetical protein [Aquabacterium sp. A7-Y]MCW7538236.1 hypothetical protein [Aquabacterium sp. A7-Y]